MLRYNEGKGHNLWELAIDFESARGNITRDQVVAQMNEIVCIMQKSIQLGIQETKYADRILGYQSGLLKNLIRKPTTSG